MAFIFEKSLKPKLFTNFSLNFQYFQMIVPWSICWINELEFARQFADNFQIANSRKIPVLKNGKLRGLSLLCSVNGQKTAQSYIIYYLSGKTISETNIRFRKTLREKSSSCRNVWCKKKIAKLGLPLLTVPLSCLNCN